MASLRHIHFVHSAWPGGHPIYDMLRANAPEGWICDRPGDDDADLVAVPTRPWYDGKRPWFLFMEDWVTLYHQEIVNGDTAEKDVLHHPRTAYLRQHFSMPSFRGIICHHRGTFRDLVALNVTNKLYYVPVGVPRQSPVKVGSGPHCTFIFINSWRADGWNFRNRGGELVLRAFRELWQEGHTNLRLKIICGIPNEVDPGERSWAFSCPGITILQHHLPDAEFYQNVTSSDCLILPAHRVHVYSHIMPLSFGIPVISSDGWGTDEYIIDGANGFRTWGVWGCTSWHDLVMRENYSRWRETLRSIPSLKQNMLALDQDRALLARLGRGAYAYANDVHSSGRQRSLLKEIFDQ